MPRSHRRTRARAATRSGANQSDWRSSSLANARPAANAAPALFTFSPRVSSRVTGGPVSSQREYRSKAARPCSLVAATGAVAESASGASVRSAMDWRYNAIATATAPTTTTAASSGNTFWRGWGGCGRPVHGRLGYCSGRCGNGRCNTPPRSEESRSWTAPDDGNDGQMESEDRTPLGRVLRKSGWPALLDLLGRGLGGADLTTLLLEVFRIRAGRLAPADVLRRYLDDRFAAPGETPFWTLRRAEDLLLSAIPDAFEMMTLSPVAPLGTHSVVGTVDQNKVVSTVRGSEVAADATNGLALEAAARRAVLDRDNRCADAVRLAAIQRVVRGQQFAGPVSFAHFSLLAVVTAGRDTGSLAFERQHATEHLALLTDALRRAGARRVQIRLTLLDPRFAPIAEAVKESTRDAEVLDDPGRQAGRGYYTGLCYKVLAGEELFELGDGGFVNWTRRLLGNRKERLLTSGIGIDRVALTLLPQRGFTPSEERP